jgi:hypothetical protein
LPWRAQLRSGEGVEVGRRVHDAEAAQAAVVVTRRVEVDLRVGVVAVAHLVGHADAELALQVHAVVVVGATDAPAPVVREYFEVSGMPVMRFMTW